MLPFCYEHCCYKVRKYCCCVVVWQLDPSVFQLLWFCAFNLYQSFRLGWSHSQYNRPLVHNSYISSPAVPAVSFSFFLSWSVLDYRIAGVHYSLNSSSGSYFYNQFSLNCSAPPPHLCQKVVSAVAVSYGSSLLSIMLILFCNAGSIQALIPHFLETLLGTPLLFPL